MSSITSVTSSEIIFQWKTMISRASDEEINSPIFTTIDGTWHLRLEFTFDSVGLYLCPTDVESSPTVRYNFWVYQDEKLLVSECTVRKFTDEQGFGSSEMIKRPLEATGFTFCVKVFAPSNTLTSPACLDSLSTIFNDAETSDVEFHIQDRCIYAHKTILIGRSSYFRAKFKEGFGETILSEDLQKQRINISEDYEAFRLIIYHLYTGCVALPSVEVEAKKVLEVSHKYEIKDLEAAMEENEIRRLSKDNVSEILFKYGYKYSDLKRECIECIVNNYKEIRDIKEFKEKLSEFADEGGNGEFIADLFLAVNK